MIKEQKKNIAEMLAETVEGMEVEDIASMIELPPDASMGDYAFPCFRLAKTMRKAPQVIAEDIATAMKSNSAFFDVKNVNAYVNFHLKQARFFVTGYNISKLFASPNYFSMPHYPINPMVVKLGVAVKFNN